MPDLRVQAARTSDVRDGVSNVSLSDSRTRREQRLLDQALRAAVRISDWLSKVDAGVGEARDLTGELIHALEQEGAEG